MVILSLGETDRVNLLTPWGVEEAIRYQSCTFLPTNAYKELKEAITACRQDLEVGLFSIVVKETNKVRVWCPLPEQLLSCNAKKGIAHVTETNKFHFASAN